MVNQEEEAFRKKEGHGVNTTWIRIDINSFSLSLHHYYRQGIILVAFILTKHKRMT
jgi:hypothetical protein